MKNFWHYVPLGKELVASIYGRKVTHVVQQNQLPKMRYVCWTGELDDDDEKNYFMIQVLDAVVMLTVSDRENKLQIEKPTQVAYPIEMKDIIDEPNEMVRVQKYLKSKMEFIPEFTEKLTFEEVMEIFNWEYSSSKIEIYEY